MRRVTKQVSKADLAKTIERKFGSLSMLVGMSGTEITPEVEAFLHTVQNDREPVVMRIQYKSHSIVVTIA
jgi:hypothetical protein